MRASRVSVSVDEWMDLTVSASVNEWLKDTHQRAHRVADESDRPRALNALEQYVGKFSAGCVGGFDAHAPRVVNQVACCDKGACSER